MNVEVHLRARRNKARTPQHADQGGTIPLSQCIPPTCDTLNRSLAHKYRAFIAILLLSYSPLTISTQNQRRSIIKKPPPSRTWICSVMELVSFSDRDQDWPSLWNAVLHVKWDNSTSSTPYPSVTLAHSCAPSDQSSDPPAIVG